MPTVIAPGEKTKLGVRRLPDGRQLYVPLEQAVQLPAGMYSAEQMRRIEEIQKGQYFLLKNLGGVTEPSRCRKYRACGQKHEFFTLMCVPQPFSGLRAALRFYVAVAHPSTPAPDFLADLMTDLTLLHPETARGLGAGLNPGDTKVFAYLLDIGLEPITKPRAQTYAQEINLEGRRERRWRPFTLERG
jgi:hypothetical protein